VESRELFELLDAIACSNPNLNLRDYLKSVVNAASAHLQAECALIYLVDTSGSPYRGAASGVSSHSEASQGVSEIVHSLPPLLIQSALNTRETHTANRLSIRPSLSSPHLPSGLLRHCIAAPITYGNSTRGVILLLNKKHPNYEPRQGRARLKWRGFRAADALTASIIGRLVGSAITTDEQYERERADRNQYFEHLVYNSPDPICVLDRHGRIVHFNQECERTWGLSEADVLGRSIDTFYESRETARDVGRTMWVSPNHTVHDYSTSIKTSSGQVVPIRLSARILLDSAGSATGSIGIFKDERATIQAQSSRLTSEKLVAISNLSQSVAHDMKHDLGALFNWLGVLETIPNNHRDFREACAGMRAAASDALAKLQNLLMAGRTLHSRLSITSMRSLLSTLEPVVRLRVEPRNTTFTVTQPASDIFVLVDTDQMRQLLSNLLNNSLEAIQIARWESNKDALVGHIELAVTASESEVVLSWSDDGCGIPEEARRKLFSPFFTTKSNGSGLGLFISRKLVESHGGLIQALSTSAIGATFRISLPRVEPTTSLGMHD